jgi:hypothetical protein
MAFIGVPCLSIIMKQANHGTGAGNNVEPPQRLLSTVGEALINKLKIEMTAGPPRGG